MPRRGGRAPPVVDTGMVNPIMNVELGHMGQRRPSSSSVSSDGGRGALLTTGGAARALPAPGAPGQVTVPVEPPLPAPVGDDALTAPDLGELGDDDVDIDAEWREPNMHDVQAFMDHYHPRLYRNGMPYPVPICAPTGRHCCWCCTCINPFCEGRHSKLAFMGVGVGGYFKWVKLIGWTAFFMALVTFPMLLINYGNGVRLSAQETELGLSRTMLGNLGTAVNNTNVFPVQDYIPYIGEYIPVDMTLDRAQVAELYTACDIAACLVFLVASCLLLSGEEGDIAHFARRIVTVDQYSVRIKAVPAGTTRKQIELLMHNVTGERVADVSIAADSNSSTALLVRRGKLLGKRDRHRQFIRLLRSKKRAVDASSSERGRIDKRIDKRFREMLKINSKLRRLHEKWQNRDEGESRSVNAFVTFDTALGRQICLEEYPQGFCFWLCQRRSKRLHGKRLTVTPAPLPSAIIWENLATRRCSRWSRRLVTLLISVALLAVSASLMYVMRSQQVDVQADSFVAIGEQCNNTLVLTASTPPVCNCTHESYTYMAANSECHGVLAAAVLSLALAGAVALVVVGVNALFGSLVEWMATYERHLVTDKMAAAAFRGLLLRQFFNTAILVILINSDVGAVFRLFGLDDPTQDLALGTNTLWEVGIAWYGTVGTPILLSTAISTVSFLFTPCIRCSARLCKRDCRCCCCCRKVMTQHELNKLFLGHQFRLHRRYARYLNQFAVGFMFSAGIPLMMWLVAAMMLIGYWFDKWWLLRKSRKPPQFNATLARLARDLMPYVLAMHLGMACVMLGNEDILVTDNLDTSAISESRYATYTQRFVDFMQRFTRIHTLPLFVFLVLVLLYLLLSQFCGVLGTIIRLATCGHCTSRGYDVDAGPGASKDMTYTEAEEGGYVHGQHTYHFVDNPWYQQRLHFTPDELESFRRAGVTMSFTMDQWVRDDTAMSSARATVVPRRSQHPVGGRAAPGAGSGGGSGRRVASPRDERVAQAMTLQRSVATAGAVVHTPSAAPSGRGGARGAEGAPLAKHPERGGVEEW